MIYQGQYLYGRERIIQILAHVCRFFESIDHIKLVQIITLADRKALTKLGHPISYDHNNPAGFEINGIEKMLYEQKWIDSFSYEGSSISLIDKEHENDLLSDAELDILDEIIEDFLSPAKKK